MDLKNPNCISSRSILLLSHKQRTLSFLIVHQIMRGDSHVYTAPEIIRPNKTILLWKRSFFFKQVKRVWLFFFFGKKGSFFKVWWIVKSEGSLSDAVSPSLRIILDWFLLLADGSFGVTLLSNEDRCVMDVNRRKWCSSCHDSNVWLKTCFKCTLEYSLQREKKEGMHGKTL